MLSRGCKGNVTWLLAATATSQGHGGAGPSTGGSAERLQPHIHECEPVQGQNY